VPCTSLRARQYGLHTHTVTSRYNYRFTRIYCNRFDERVARQQLCKHGPTRYAFYVVRAEQRWKKGVMQPVSKQQLGKHISGCPNVPWKSDVINNRDGVFRGVCVECLKEKGVTELLQGSYESVVSWRSESRRISSWVPRFQSDWRRNSKKTS
jgi:hypothetical protein